MKCFLQQCTVLLTCVLLAAGEAGAAGREIDRKASASSTETSSDWRRDQENWLARLQGRFTITLKMAATYVTTANCRSVGNGPGLHCALEDMRQTSAAGVGFGKIGDRVFLADGLPTRMLLGIDPVARKIRLMFMDGYTGYSATGTASGNTLTLKGQCDLEETENKRAFPCSWSLSIRASPDGSRILMTRDINDRSRKRPFTFELIRVEQPAQPRH